MYPNEFAQLRASYGVPRDAFVIGHVGGLIPLCEQVVILRGLEKLIKKGVIPTWF